MKKLARPVWMMPALVTGSVAALGALGTLAVKSATYITLPEKVEAAVQKNSEQDQVLNKLTGIQETWQQIYQQQQQVPNQAVPRTAVREWRDPETGQWWCCEEDTGCQYDKDWYRCD